MDELPAAPPPTWCRNAATIDIHAIRALRCYTADRLRGSRADSGMHRAARHATYRPPWGTLGDMTGVLEKIP